MYLIKKAPMQEKMCFVLYSIHIVDLLIKRIEFLFIILHAYNTIPLT